MIDYTAPEVFERIKESWSKAEQDALWTGFDAELIPLLKKLNKFEYIATFMSCASHAEKRGKRFFYITFAYNEKGMKQLAAIFNELRSIMLQTWPEVSHLIARRLSLSFSVRTMSVAHTHPTLCDDSEQFWWNSACIQMDIPIENPVFKAQFIKLFEDVVSTVLQRTAIY